MLSIFSVRLFALVSLVLVMIMPFRALSAPYATQVVDARNGQIIYSHNANQKLHPASLTKMMTLYIAFAELEAGRISLESNVRISNHAASQPPSKMGLRAGSTIKFKYLVRAAAIKSANDASVAIAEAIAGSQQNFSAYMNSTARKLGMNSTNFKNPHGLTQSGHYSTASDMAKLGRHIVYDYPRYYNLFSRHYAETPLGNFSNSNIRFLKDYPGADGIKTGYTRAAGYNLVATAKRGNERMIVSMFGGQSSYQRNEQIGALLDLGFRKATSNVRVSNISRPRLSGVQRQNTQPAPQPQTEPQQPTTTASQQSENTQARPQRQITIAANRPAARPNLNTQVAVATSAVTTTAPAAATTTVSAVSSSLGTVQRPQARQESQLNVQVAAILNDVQNTSVALAPTIDSPIGMVERPPTRPNVSQSASVSSSSSAAGAFAIQLDSFSDKSAAENAVINALSAIPSYLSDAPRTLVSVNSGYRPRFSGLSRSAAYNACSELGSVSDKCFVIAPSE